MRRARNVVFAACACMVVAHASPPPPPPGPDEIFHRATSAAWKAMQACSTDPKLVGDVTVRIRDRAWTLSPSRSLGKAGSRIAACVRDAIARELPRDFRGRSEHTHRFGVTVPVLPPPAMLIAAWKRGSHAELKALLPPDHSLTRGRCIKADRDYAQNAMYLWMPSVGPWVPRMWDKLLAQALGHPVHAAMWDPAGAFVTLSPRGLCYEPFDAAKQTSMRAQMDLAGRCLAGGFEDALLRPRFEFPATKRYTGVSVNGFTACALSTAGDVTCCGGVEPALPAVPSGLVSIELGGTFLCGLDAKRAIHCSGSIPAPPKGAFTKLGAGYAHACAVRVDGALVCWGAANYDLKKPPKGPFVDVAVAQGSACGIRRDGTAACWGERASAGTPVGRFTAIEAQWTHACAIRRDRTIGCWRDRAAHVESPSPDRVDQIAVGDLFRVCGRRLDKTVGCWGLHASEPTKVIPPPAGKFAQLDGELSMYCGAREHGPIECWGVRWPGTWAGDNTWPYTAKLFGGTTPPAIPPLAGRVVDERGAPIANAEVIVCGESGVCAWLRRQARRTPGTLRALLATLPHPPAAGSYALVTTAADGTFRASVPSWRHEVVATAPGRELVEQSVYPGTDVALRPASTVELKPRCGARACTGKLRVSLSEHEHHDTLRLERMPPGSYDLRVIENWGEPGERANRKVVDVTFAAKSIQTIVNLRPSGTGKSIRGTIDVPHRGTTAFRVSATCGEVARVADVDPATGAFELRDVGAPPCTVRFATNADGHVEVKAVPASGIVLRGRLLRP